MTQMIDPKSGETLFDPACGTGGFLTCALHNLRERYVKHPEDEARMQTSLRAVEKKPLPPMAATPNMLTTSRIRSPLGTTTRWAVPTFRGDGAGGWISF